MTRRRRFGFRLGLVVALVASGTWFAAQAQNFTGLVPPVPSLPQVPPRGAWGEVIMANSKWLVVQNHSGQQFPVLLDNAHVNQFLVRWPTDPSNLTPASLIEAIGPNLGSNTLQTDHVDVFEGADQLLVTPTYRSVLPNNMAATTIDPSFSSMMNTYQTAVQMMYFGWAFPVSPNLLGTPGALHVVGNVVQVSPAFQLGIPGNNIATIVPGASGSISMTQVTQGSSSFLEKGDLVFLVPINLDQKSLILQQLVLYKKIPRNRFGL